MFRYQNCRCLAGFELKNITGLAPGAVRTKHCAAVSEAPVSLIAVSTASGAALLLVLSALAAMWLIMHRHALGPPGAGLRSRPPMLP